MAQHVYLQESLFAILIFCNNFAHSLPLTLTLITGVLTSKEREYSDPGAGITDHNIAWTDRVTKKRRNLYE